MKKHLIKLILIIILSISLCICLLPLPTKINVTLSGVGLHSYDEIINSTNDPISITISGWKLNYLFFKDQMNLNISISAHKNREPFEAEAALITTNAIPEAYLGLMGYDTVLNRHISGSMTLTNNLEHCTILGEIAERYGYKLLHFYQNSPQLPDIFNH